MPMLTSEADRKPSPLIGKDWRRNLSWILYSALVAFISILIGWAVPNFARVFEEMGIEVSGLTRTVFTLGKARLISIPVWLAISLGGALAIHYYSKKPTQYIFLLRIIMVLFAVLVVVALCCAVFT
jgi:type II secretory pathway component PulF